MRGVEQIPWAYDLLVGLFERTGLGRWRRWHAEGAFGRTRDLVLPRLLSGQVALNFQAASVISKP